MQTKPANDNGLQRLKAGRHLGGVADLMELSFAQQMDQGGQEVIREMRLVGRLGPLARGLTALGLVLPVWSEGFVWLTAGRVVGCLNTTPMTQRPGAWLIVNVAVHPNYRRHGIARALLQAALDFARQHGAREAWLEVDDDNAGAIKLYEQTGFTYLTTRTLWIRLAHLALPPRPPAPYPIRYRRAAEWPAQLALAQAVRPHGLEWQKPLQAQDFQPDLARAWYAWLAGPADVHWVVVDPAAQLLGSLTARFNCPDGNRLSLLTQPAATAQLAEPLLIQGLHTLAGHGGAARLEHPADDQAVNAVLRRLEFEPARTVRWMKKDLT